VADNSPGEIAIQSEENGDSIVDGSEGRSGARVDGISCENRRMIDENWSLGADRALAGQSEEDAEYSESDVVPYDGRPLNEILSSVCPMCLDVSHGVHECPMLRSSEVQPVSTTQHSPGQSVIRPTLLNSSLESHHTEQLVQNLSVSVSVSEVPPQMPPITETDISSDTESNSLRSAASNSQHSAGGGMAPTSPQTMANNLAILNERLFQQRRRIGAAAISLVDQVLTPPPPLTPSPPPLRDPFTLRMPGYFRNNTPSFRSPPVPPMPRSSSPNISAAVVRHSPPVTSSARLPGLIASSESEPDTDNSSDTDTWGGTFSLRHTRRQAEQVEPPINDATIVSRLTSRTLYALTDSLGIPHGLRPCFAVEAARLQLTLALFNHQSITCDRNCEGDESDSDSEEDWLATDTDTEEETAEENEAAQPPLTDSEDSTESSVSDFSQRSWFGSQAELTEARRLTPRSSFSPQLSSSPRSLTSDSEGSGWLPEREDLRSVRQFLASSPGPEFHHSTDSESESSGGV